MFKLLSSHYLNIIEFNFNQIDRIKYYLMKKIVFPIIGILFIYILVALLTNLTKTKLNL